MESLIREVHNYLFMTNLIWMVSSLSIAGAILLYREKGMHFKVLWFEFLCVLVVCIYIFFSAAWQNFCLIYWPIATVARELLH